MQAAAARPRYTNVQEVDVKMRTDDYKAAQARSLGLGADKEANGETIRA